ncbi:MAG: hypothetical protein ABJE10_04635 [bacterium]
MNSDPLRDAYAAHTKAHTGADRSNCPSPELLEAVARGLGHSGAEHARDVATLDHVLSCAHCRPEFDLLRTVTVAAEKADLVRHSTRVAFPLFAGWSRSRLLVAASALLAVALVGEAWRRTRSTGSDAFVVRGNDGEVTLVAPVMVEAMPLASVRAFTWQSVPGASAYTIELLDTTNAVLVSRITPDTTISLTDDELARVKTASTFDWMVTARRGDGNERRSALTRIRLLKEP